MCYADLYGHDGELWGPVQQIDEGSHSDEDQPEPDEQEDLLVEEVDRQDTLDGVAVYVHALLADLDVA